MIYVINAGEDLRLSYAIKGNYLLNSSCRYREEVHAMTEYDKASTTIEAQGIIPLTVSVNQKFLVRGASGFKHEKEAYKIKEGQFLGIPLERRELIPDLENRLLQPYAADKDLWWIAGRYLADGWYKGDADGRHVISVGPTKTEDVERLRQFGGTTIAMDNKCTRVFFSRKVWGTFFRDLCGTGSTHKYLSSCVMELPKDLLRAFLEGYLRGDGYCRKGSWEVKTVSRSLALDLQRAIGKAYGQLVTIKENVVSTRYVIRGRTVRRAPYQFRLYFRLSDSKRKCRCLFENNYIWTPVTKIVSHGNELNGVRVVMPKDIVCNNVVMKG